MVFRETEFEGVWLVLQA